MLSSGIIISGGVEMLKLREIRKNRSNLTMKELGDLVGVSESAIGYWETGKRQPSLDMLPLLAEALGCKVRDLIDAEEEEPAPHSDDDALLAETNFLYDSPDALDLIRACMNLSGEQIHLLALIAGEMEPKSKKTAVKKHSGSGLVVSADL
jgi:transcriptional regulator with XRE-family HTH domain